MHSSISVKKKIKKKREKNEKRDLCFIQKSYMYMYVKKSGILVCNFFVSYDSWVGPTIQTAIFQCVSLVRQTISSIRYKLLLFCNGSTKHVIYTKKERTNYNKSSMDAIPCYSEFTCAILSISSISRLTIA